MHFFTVTCYTEIDLASGPIGTKLPLASLWQAGGRLFGERGVKRTADANMIPASPLIGFASDEVQPNAAGSRHARPAPFESWPEDESAAAPEAVLDGGEAVAEDPLVSLARHFHRTRRAGNAIFGKRVISDPQFDMLLELFVAHHEARAVSTTGLCRAGGVPATTALRYIDKLEAGGFLRREVDSSDARRSLVVPTDKAIRCTTELMAEFRSGGKL